jgi:hypothetical protein
MKALITIENQKPYVKEITNEMAKLIIEKNKIFNEIINRDNFKLSELTDEDKLKIERTRQIYFILKDMGLCFEEYKAKIDFV